MLTELTIEQQQLMIQVRKEWIQRAYSCQFNIDANKKFLHYIYQKINFPDPQQIIVDSPLACQYMVYLLKNNKIFNVWDNVRANVRNNVRDNVRANVWDNVRANVWDNVQANVGDNVWDNVRNNVWDNVKNNIQNNNISFELFCGECDWSDFGWVSFYDFFKHLSLTTSDFTEYLNMFKEGHMFMWIAFQNVAIISLPPIYLHTEPIENDLFRLHDATRAAVEFKDGYKQYYVHGVYFEESIWSQFFPKRVNMTLKEIMQISNTEQRTAVIQEYGFETLLDQIDSKRILETYIEHVVHRDQYDQVEFEEDKTGHLIEFELDQTKQQLVVLPDHATNRKYYILVPPECDSYLHAKLWHNGFEKEEWDHVQYQSEC